MIKQKNSKRGKMLGLRAHGMNEYKGHYIHLREKVLKFESDKFGLQNKKHSGLLVTHVLILMWKVSRLYYKNRAEWYAYAKMHNLKMDLWKKSAKRW